MERAFSEWRGFEKTASYWMAVFMIGSEKMKNIQLGDDMADTVVLKNGDFFALADMPNELTAQVPKGGKIRFMLEETGDEWTADFNR